MCTDMQQQGRLSCTLCRCGLLKVLFLFQASPRFVRKCPFVFLLSLQCHVMPQLCPSILLKSQHIPYVVLVNTCYKQKASAKTYKGNQRGQTHSSTCSFSLKANSKTFESLYPVICKTIFTIYQGSERTISQQAFLLLMTTYF